MTITVYQSTDADAPVLTKEAGTLKTVLKACLVTGYGATPGKGWNALFEGTNKIALQSSDISSSGCVIRIDDTLTTGLAMISTYHSMTDIDTGTGLFSEANHSISKAYQGANTDSRPWTVIADEKRFYLFTNFYETGNYHNDGLFFGDFTSYLPTDNFNCLLVADNNTAVHSRNPFIRNGEIYCAADASQLNAMTKMHLSSIGDVSSNQGGTWTYPSTVTNGFCMFPAYIRENYAASYDYRGVMPGLYYTPFKIHDSVPDNTILSNVAGVPSGQRILIKHSSVHTTGNPMSLGINIDNWD